ncbi:MAG: hypothetical protein ACLP1X_20005 [Polyangiaceae bacterium]|jgi:hypothetical protein
MPLLRLPRLVAAASASLCACGLSSGGLLIPDGLDSGRAGDRAGGGVADDASDSDSDSESSTDDSGTLVFGGTSSGSTADGAAHGADGAATIDASACKAGVYAGNLGGSYSSPLILGVPLAVTGTMTFSLGAASNAGTLPIVGGVITGVAKNANMGGMGGSYPYSCAITGALDCAADELVGGWLMCTYCVTTLADGGVGCAPVISGIGSGIGGQFAGPFDGTYNTGTLSFAGTWNGAEALAGSDGGSGPNGQPVSNFLSLDGGYGPGNYGGSGTWTVSHQ